MRTILRWLLLFLLFASLVAAQELDAARLRGKVTDPTGKLLANANVTLNRWSGAKLDRTKPFQCVTDQDGRYELPLWIDKAFPLNLHEVFADAKGYARAAPQINLAVRAGENANLDFMLSAGEPIAGRIELPLPAVRGPGAVPEASKGHLIRVDGDYFDSLPYNARHFFSQPDGRFEIYLPPGVYDDWLLDEALAELNAGRKSPSSRWKVRFGFLLGLERVLSMKPPTTAAGTELRKHQIDALAGMLTELIAANQRHAEDENGNGNGEAELEPEEVEEEDEAVDDEGEDEPEEGFVGEDPGAIRRYRFRHPTASGKTIAAAGFVEAARSLGILILTHRRLLVTQFQRDLTTEGYGDRFTDFIERGKEPLRGDPITIQTYAWFARHADSLSREAYQLVICDEAHTALGEKTSAAIRSFPEPIYIGMTATEQLIAKQVSDVFPASVDDLPLADAARRGLIAPLRCLRVPPAAAINSVPIVGGDFEERALAAALDHQALNQAAASLYRERFDSTPGIVYAAGVDHAYNLAQEFRAAGLKAEAVSGRTPPVRLAETLAAYERGEINVKGMLKQSYSASRHESSLPWRYPVSLSRDATTRT
jgi:hypothetical protein